MSLLVAGTDFIRCVCRRCAPAFIFILVCAIGAFAQQAPNCSIPAADFGLAAGPATVVATATSAANYSVTVYPYNGFTGPVSLSLSGLPAGVSATLNGSSTLNAAPGSSTLTLTDTSAAAGTYPISISGAYGSLSHNAGINLQIGAVFISGVSPNSGPVGTVVTPIAA